MTFQIYFFNWAALAVSFVAFMLIGALWYSPVLFGKIWMKELGIKEEDISREEGTRAMLLSMLPALVSVGVVYILLAFLNARTLPDALIVGSLASLGLVGMNALNLTLFEGRSLKLVCINAGYSFVSLNTAALIMTLWK